MSDSFAAQMYTDSAAHVPGGNFFIHGAVHCEVDGTGGHYLKQSKSKKNKYQVPSLVCGIETKLGARCIEP